MKRKLIVATLICTLTMSSVALAAPETKFNGKCGDNLEYSYSEKTHVLTISGEGSLYDYKDWESLPWSTYFDDVSRVKLKDDVSVPLWAISRKAADKHFADTKPKTKPNKTETKKTKEKPSSGQVIKSWE